MIAREKAVAIIEEYCRCLTERDRRGWLSLMSEKIIHEDPVGVRTNTGHEMVGRFWDLFDGYNMRVTLTAPTIVCGSEAIAFMRAEAGPADARHVTAPIVDNFVFDEDGKIARVRAFYEG
jgi:steroid Delta-isomerase